MAARFGISLVLSAMLVGTAGAQTTHFFDNFDSYTDQADFEADWPIVPPAAAGGASPPSNFWLTGTITPTTPAGNTTSVTPVSGNNMIGHNDLSATRNERNIGTTGLISTTNTVSFSFDFFDFDGGVAPFRQFSNLQDTQGAVNGVGGLGTNQLVSIGLNNNQGLAASGGNFYMARILGYNPHAGLTDPDGGPAEDGIAATPVPTNSPFFKLNDFVDSPLRSTGWHNLRVDISTDDDLSTDYDFYIDGVLAERVHNIGTAAQIRKYDYIRLGSGLTATRVAFTDNMSVVLNPVVEEPDENADFNGDNIVDGADFLIWQRGFGTGNNLASGDANGDLAVTDADLAIWKSQFGTDPTPAVGAVSAVPEPTTLALAGLAMVAAGLAARRS